MSSATDLAVESISLVLYWVTSAGQVRACDLDLQNSETIHQFLYEVPAGVAVFEDFLYVTLSSNNSIARINRLGRERKIGIITVTLSWHLLFRISEHTCGISKFSFSSALQLSPLDYSIRLRSLASRGYVYCSLVPRPVLRVWERD